MRTKSMMGMLLLLATITACSGASVSEQRELFVRVDNIQVVNGGTVVFSSGVAGTTAGTKTVVLSNAGGKDLTIDSIALEPGGNSFITMNADFTAASFPMVLKANSLGIGDITFTVSYSPGTGYDDRDSVLRVVSNDSTTDNQTYRVVFAPSVKAAQLAVSPTNYTFVNATAAVPSLAQFTLSNSGTETLVIDSVVLQNASSEFTILDPPNQGTTIDPKGSGGIDSVMFSLRYAPIDTPDENVILVRWSPVGGAIQETGIPVAGQTQAGTLEITYSDQSKGFLDFSEQVTVGARCAKVVNIMNQGPGPVQLKLPNIVQPTGSTAYTVKWYQAGGTQTEACGAYTGTEIQGAQYGLSNQRAVDVVVEYTAPTVVGVNGTLEIAYNNPGPVKVSIPLVGGSPKGEFDLAPGNAKLAFYRATGEEVKTGVIVNRGTGTLTIKSVNVVKSWGVDPDAFTLLTSVPANTELPAWSLLPFEIEFNTDYETTSVNASLDIVYVDPLTGSDATASLFLEGRKDFGAVVVPSADAGQAADYAGAKVDEVIHLDGSKSSAGTHPIWTTGYLWYLSQKPAGSKAILNVAGSGPQTDFLPDAAGSYTFKMHVFSIDSATSTAYFGNEASVTVQVSE